MGPPVFFVSVACKGLRYSASSLFATHRRGLGSVASKGLRLHQNCAEWAHFRLREWPSHLHVRHANGCAKVLKKGPRGVERREKRGPDLGEESFPARSKPSRQDRNRSVDSRCSLRMRILEGCASRVPVELAGVQLIQEYSAASANCQ